MQGAPLKVVILCGGHSSRMGMAKHLLVLSDGRSICQHLLMRANNLSGVVSGLYISVRNAEQAHSLSGLDTNGLPFQIIFDEIPESNHENPTDIGPAAGLLAAYRTDSESSWLVIACDYPFFSSSDMQVLLDYYDGRLTCFQNVEGWNEPLLAIWSPYALRHLQRNVEKGATGPSKVIKDLGAKTVQLADSRSLYNANTVEQWNRALEMMKDMTLFA